MNDSTPPSSSSGDDHEGKLKLSEEELTQLMCFFGYLRRHLGIDGLMEEIERVKGDVAGLKIIAQQSLTRTNENLPQHGFSREVVTQSDEKIKIEIGEIKSLLKFREGIKGGDLLEKGNYLMKSVPGEIEILKSGKVSGIEYSRRKDILKFSLHTAKVFFESIERPDLVERTENFIEEVKRI